MSQEKGVSLSRTQQAIALMLVGTFCTVVLALMVGPVITGERQTEAHELLKTFFAYCSGFVGIVIGNLFGRGSGAA